MLKKLPDLELNPYVPPICVSPNHAVPTHMLIESGSYEWHCPDCKHVTFFIVPKVYF